MSDKRRRAWRFPAPIEDHPQQSSVDESWVLGKQTTAAFKRLIDTACPILTQCKAKCRAAKLRGSIEAITQLMHWIKFQHNSNVSMNDLQTYCCLLLEQQQHPEIRELIPHQKGPSREEGADSAGDRGVAGDACLDSQEEPHAAAYTEPGWEAVDSMFTDPEFIAGCRVFTEFFKERTKEIRTAFVCGFRDALSEVLSWAAGQGDIMLAMLCQSCQAQLETLTEKLGLLISIDPSAKEISGANPAKALGTLTSRRSVPASPQRAISTPVRGGGSELHGLHGSPLVTPQGMHEDHSAHLHLSDGGKPGQFGSPGHSRQFAKRGPNHGPSVLSPRLSNSVVSAGSSNGGNNSQSQPDFDKFFQNWSINKKRDFVMEEGGDMPNKRNRRQYSAL